jgi:Flp pilus assembly protein TadG
MRSRRDQGTVTAFVAVVSFALVMVAGMVYDGGQILDGQARARDVAANAARAGAQEIDLDALRDGGTVALNPERAIEAAEQYLLEVGVAGRATVVDDQISVEVSITVPMLILPGQDRTVRSTDTVNAVAGLVEGDTLNG